MWYQIEVITAGPPATEIEEELPIETLLPKLEQFLIEQGWKVEHTQAFLIPFYDRPVILERED